MNDPTQEGESETEKINVVPLADLTLVLLIVLMVISPMISQSMIHVSTPAVKADKNIEEQKDDPDKKGPEPLMIGLSAQGYTLNNTPAEDLGQLIGAVKARLIEEPERNVLVTADNEITVGPIVEILDLVKQQEGDVADGANLDRSKYKIKVSLLKKADGDQPGAEGENPENASPVTKSGS